MQSTIAMVLAFTLWASTPHISQCTVTEHLVPLEYPSRDDAAIQSFRLFSVKVSPDPPARSKRDVVFIERATAQLTSLQLELRRYVRQNLRGVLCFPTSLFFFRSMAM